MKTSETRDAFAPPPAEGAESRDEDAVDSSWSLPVRESDVGECRPPEEAHDELEADRQSAVAFLWYGHRALKSRRELEAGWKAVRAVATGGAPLSEDARILLVGRMCATGVPPSVVDAVMAFDGRDDLPGNLLAPIALTEDLRTEVAAWVLYEGISVAFARLGERELERLRSVGATLGIGRATVDALVDLCCDEAFLRARRIALLREDVGMLVRSLVLPFAPPSAAHREVEPGPGTPTAAEQKIPGELRATRPWRP